MPLYRNLGAWLLGVASMSGCYQAHDCINREIADCCNRNKACMAWMECRWNYAECQDYLCDFGNGFREGYANVMGGGEGCVPALPPRKYWGNCYQNADGHAAVVAWFDGYQHGAAVAKADGGGSYGRVPSSDDIYRRNCQMPVDLNLDAFKNRNTGAGEPPALMDGDVPPLPEGELAPMRNPSGVPYSPEVLPDPAPEEAAPSAE
jgi:hypothetical protein